jgi:hypothetical protein
MTTDGKITVASAFAHLNPQQALAEGISGGFSRIGDKGKVWSLHHQGEIYRFVREDDGTSLPYLDVVFVGVNPVKSRTYYAEAYNEDSAGVGPTCASLKGDVPDPGVPIPQSKTCAICSHSRWLPNNKGQECKEHKRTAVILLPYMKTKPPLEAPVLEPVFLKIPPASLGSFKRYSDSLMHRGAHFASVVTRITFDAQKLWQMNFDVKQPLTNAEAPLVLPALDDPHTLYLTGTMPEISEVPQERPALATRSQDTGLVQAFGQHTQVPAITAPTAPRPRGRPRKTEPVQEVAPQHGETVDKPTFVGEKPAWEDADDELDASVKELMARKMGSMMP